MAAGGHFGCPNLTFDGISGHFRSIRFFFLTFLQNGHRCPFWMSENNFRSHFWPFQIDTQLDKMAAVGHFGFPKFTFDRISGHFRSIQNFCFLNFFYKMAAGSHFGCPKFIFDRISGHFRSIHMQLKFFLHFLENGRRWTFWMFENHF